MCRFYRFLIVFVAGIFAPVLYTSAYTAQTVQPVSGKTGFQTIVALHKHLRSMPDQHTQSAREQAKALIILIATGDMKDSSGKTVSFGVNPDPSLTTEAQRNEMIDAIHLTAATNHSLEYYLEALLDHPQKHFNVSHIRAVRYYFKDAPAFKLPPPPSFDLSKLPPPIFSDMTSSPSADSRPKFNPPSSFPGLPPPLNFGSTPPHTQQQSNAEEKPSPTVIPKRSQGFGNLLDEIKNRKHKSKKDNANAKKGNTSSSQPSQPMTHQSYDPDHPDAHSLDDFMAALGELLSNDGGQRVIDNL
ncbi:MAG: hypothetical protein K2X98_03720, partial [Alphaproteobacteria bacterium]|nr:hypothetical protein [Alphaproteobacteria bacterium]